MYDGAEGVEDPAKEELDVPEKPCPPPKGETP
jgi:hypothetical protein